MKTRDTFRRGRQARPAGIPNPNGPARPPKPENSPFRKRQDPDRDWLDRADAAFRSLAQEQALRRQAGALPQQIRSREAAQPEAAEEERLIDAGVLEWLESDKALRSPPTESKWPETAEELIGAPAENSPDNRVLPLAGTGNIGYNEQGITKFANAADVVIPVLNDDHTGQQAVSAIRLEYGSDSDDVKTLQKWLNALGYTDENRRPLVVDGEFGPHTLAAVNKFKDAVLPGGNLGENRGVVGPTTWEALENRVANKLLGESQGLRADKSIEDQPGDNNLSVQDIVSYKTPNERFDYLFGDEENYSADDLKAYDDYKKARFYYTEEEALSHMVGFYVNVWIYDEYGNKVPSKMWIQVNEKIADIVATIFEEIFNDPEQFVFNKAQTGAYNWRYGYYDEKGNWVDGPTEEGRFSEHSHGIAIDINWGDNPYYRNGNADPGSGPYAITRESSVYRIFKKYGWTWGGDWTSCKDFMHFEWSFN